MLLTELTQNCIGQTLWPFTSPTGLGTYVYMYIYTYIHRSASEAQAQLCVGASALGMICPVCSTALDQVLMSQLLQIPHQWVIPKSVEHLRMIDGRRQDVSLRAVVEGQLSEGSSLIMLPKPLLVFYQLTW